MKLPEPHAAQIQIKAEANRFNVVCCGRRFGKSVLGEDSIIGPAIAGYEVGWFSPDYKSLLPNWRNICKLLRSITLRKSEQEHRLELYGGGVIEFWALDKDPECSRGRKYKRVIIDEAAKVRHLMQAWREAIRANLTDYEGDAWFLSTPKGRNDFWELYQRGKDPTLTEWSCWQMPTESNPHLKPHEIVALRFEVGPRLANQEVDAVFLEQGGRYFDEYFVSDHGEESPHEIYSTSMEIKPHWTMRGGFDWGKAAPFAFGLNVTDERGNVIVIDEEYDAGESNEEQAVRILRCLERNGKTAKDVLIYADPSIFPPKNPAKRIGRYTVEDFWKHGLRFVAANNDRVNGWTRVKEYMRLRSTYEQAGQEITTPGLRIFKDKCPNLCRTIPLMVADENNPEDLDTTLEDHACDGMLRYGIQRPHPSKAEEKPKEPPTDEEKKAAMDAAFMKKHSILNTRGKRGADSKW